MIKLAITPHCHYCLDFEVDVENAEILYAYNEPLGIYDTIIRCKHRESCEGVKGYNTMLSKLSSNKKEHVLKNNNCMNVNCNECGEKTKDC